MMYWGDPDTALSEKMSDDYYAELSCPTCHGCKQKITLGGIYEIDGWDYCESCAKENVLDTGDLEDLGIHECDECGKELVDTEYDEDPHKVGNFILCGDCLEKMRVRELAYGIA